MKKFLAILLAAMMLLALATTASAATVTVTNAMEDHTFTAYQVFTGTQAADEEKGAMGDIVWGDGVDTNKVDNEGKNLIAALQAKFPSWVWPTDREITAQDVADLLSANDTDAKAFAKVVYNFTDKGVEISTETTELAVGYYLIVDTTDEEDMAADAYNASLLQVTGFDEISITVKTDKPSQMKKVQENVKPVTDVTTTEGTVKYNYTANKQDNYNDTADYSIGDVVPFAIYSTVPDTTYYDTYKMVFHDTMDEGLTFQNDVNVTINGIDVNEYFKVTENCDDGCTFEVCCENIKAIPGINYKDPIEVTFTAKLNEKAKIGKPGNENDSKLEFSNKPDVSTSTGNTPWDTVVVFTYELDVNKTDGTNSLTDAEFVFYREVVENGETVNEYVKVDAQSKVTGWTTNMAEASTLTSANGGLFKVIGIDDGTYFLKETKAPNGYNLLTDPIQVKVSADTKHQIDYDAGEFDMALDTVELTVGTGENATTSTDVTVVDGQVTGSSGIVKTEVVNKKGAALPETGGIGTTLFYMFGGIMAAGSALMLVVRRRADAEEE